MSRIRVVILPGDGVGVEVTRAMQHVLEAVARRYSHELDLEEYAVGWNAYDSSGTPLPDETLEACLKGPAVFLGAVGDPRADGLSLEYGRNQLSYVSALSFNVLQTFGQRRSIRNSSGCQR